MAVRIFHMPENPLAGLNGRFERKYYINPAHAGFAYRLLSQLCRKAREYPSERINSLYFDTANLDQHETSSSGDYFKDKVRIRWYGEEDAANGMQVAFIELKSRRGFAGIKHRREICVPTGSLALCSLGRGIVPLTLLMNTLAEFGYFPPGMLQPVIKISYWRYSFREIETGQRVSLDSHIKSTMVMPCMGNGEKNLGLWGGVIELKGNSMEIPESLKQLELLYTDWTRFSKYSACIDAHCERQGAVGRLSPSGRLV